MIREGRAPTDPWLPSDRALALALTLHEQSRGPCGHHMDEAYDGRGAWDVGTTVCSACAAEERYRKDNEDPEPGLKVFPVNERDVAKAPGEVEPEFS